MVAFKVVSAEYVPAEQAYLEQGVKGHRRPYGAVAGDNGSFVMAGAPPQIRLILSTGQTVDIYPLVKGKTTKTRVTEKYATQVCKAIIGKEFESDRDLAAKVLENL